MEGLGNISELFQHMLAHLSRWDYIITIGKILAWIAVFFTSPGGWAAFAVKLASVVLDLVGLAEKVPEMEAVGWVP